jgi:TamB, inner membrane protein subunit of TAM complex
VDLKLKARRIWLVILLLLLAGGIWLTSNPRALVPVISRVITHNLLKDQGTFRFRDFSGSIREDISLTDVSLTIRSRNGADAYIAVDSLKLKYNFREIFQDAPRLHEARFYGAQILTRRGRPAEGDTEETTDGTFRLPEFRCDDFALYDSEFTLAGSTGKLEQNVPVLNWRGAVQTGRELVLVSRESEIWWETHSSRIQDLQGVIRTDGARFTCERVTATINESQIAMSGHRNSDGEIMLELSSDEVSTPEVEDLIDINLGFLAHGKVTMTFRAAGDIVDMDYAFDGELEGYNITEFTGTSRLEGTDLTWPHMEGRINGALFSGTGYFDLKDPEDVIMTLVGDVADVDMSQDIVPEVVLPTTDGWGHMNLWRQQSSNQTRVIGWLKDGMLDTVPFDSVSVDIFARPDSVFFRRFDLFNGPATANLTGAADSTGYFIGNLDLQTTDLTRLPKSLAPHEFRGRLTASGMVEGMDPIYNFAGNAVAAQAGIAKLDVDTCDMILNVDDVLGQAMVMGTVAGDGLSLGGVNIGEFELDGLASAEMAMIHSFRSSRGDTSVSFRGQADFSGDVISVYVPDILLELEDGIWGLNEPLKFSVGEGYLAMDVFSFQSEYGTLSAQGLWDESNALVGGEMQISGIDISVLEPFLETSTDLTGVCSGDFIFEGTTDDPVVSGSLILVDSDFPLARIDSLQVTGRYSNGFVDISDLDLLSDHGRVAVNGNLGAADVGIRSWWQSSVLDLNVDVVDGNWTFLDQFAIPALDRISGRLNGGFHLGGTTSRPEIEGGMNSRPFNIHWLHLDELNGSVHYADGQLTLGDLYGFKDDLLLHGRIELPLDLDLLNVPYAPLDGPLYMSLTVPDNTPLTALSSATNAFAESGGYGSVSVVVSGRADHPYYSGRASIRDGSCVIRGLNEVYHGISCEGDWQGDILSIRNIVGGEGARGTLNGSGELEFKGLELVGFDMRLAADRFLVSSIPDLRVLVKSDEIALTSRKVGPDSVIVPKFSGDLEVIRARYVGNFEEQPGVLDPLIGTVAPEWLADLDINAPHSSVHIKNSTMELALGGSAGFVRDLEGMNANGALTINQGRLPVFNNDFRVVSGNLDFSVVPGVIPNVDMQAETSVRLPAPEGGSRRLEKINVAVTGSARAPQVEFSSESGYARNNIERMLLGLSPHATDAQTSTIIQKETLAAGFNMLEREVAQEFDFVDTFDIESGREREDGTTQMLIGAGWFFGQGFYIKVSQAVTDQDREAVVEYQLSDSLLLQSEISRRQGEFMGDTTYSVDLKYRYEY